MALQLRSSSYRDQRNLREKNRRKLMKDLVGELSSLIPHQPKISVSNIIDGATSYIVHLQKNKENLKKRIATLKGDDQERNDLTGTGSSSRILPIMSITTSDSTMEVNLICGSNRNFKLYEIISVIEGGGAEVIDTTQVNAGDRVIYTIKSEATIPRIGIDTSRVEEQLKQLLLRTEPGLDLNA